MSIAAEVEPCATCRYWSRDEPQYVYGMCRRLPPRATLWVRARKGTSDRVEVSMQTSSVPEWPNTGSDDGCGEHQYRAEMHKGECDA